jgi:peptide methionine sulfoxide reductase MsrB
MIDTSPQSPAEAPISPQPTSSSGQRRKELLPPLCDATSISVNISNDDGDGGPGGVIPATASGDGGGDGPAKNPSDRPSRFLLSPTRSSSFTSPKGGAARPTLGVRPRSFAARRRAHEVDGRPLPHWETSNFEPRRDETCRVVYEPKDGARFFHKNLDLEDYQVMRSLSLEQPYFSKYNRFFPKRGHFCCKACGNALYDHSSKVEVGDGWPAFGACVDGAVGIIPAEERNLQIQRENDATVKIQAFVRGIVARVRVSKLLEGLIQELMQQREQSEKGNNDGDGEREEGKGKGEMKDDESSSAERQPHQPHAMPDAPFLMSPTKIKVAKTKAIRYTLLRALGDDYTEIHCHRCKSHLGDVLVEDNTGRNGGQPFKERHRVNGRALKYVEDDLPKRVVVDASLLFASQSKRRILSLPEPKRQSLPEVALRTTPFVSPRAKRRSLTSTTNNTTAFRTGNGNREASSSSLVSRRRLSFDPLSVSCHEPSSTTSISCSTFKMRGRKPASTFDPLGSVSCHERSATKAAPLRLRANSLIDESEYEETPTVAARRGRKKSTVNIQERKAALEEFILSKSMH